ncbi:MAG: phosphonate ABC transporter, permease protein PhnE [Acholeplasmataceae bacterium]|nr:phosphonate ABC transporter, permease protein PhnE [Acholeplasmataceae bacterium]
MDNILLAYEKRPKNHFKIILSLSIILFLAIWSVAGIKYPGLQDNGRQIAANIVKSLVNPTWEILWSLESYHVPMLMFETIGIAFLGTLLGAVLAIPFAFLTAKNIVGKFSFIGSTIITTIRSFPFYLVALMFVRVSGAGPMTGTLTIGVLSIGMISKLYIEVIEDIDPGIIQALDAMGANVFQKIRYGIIPQLTASMISVIIYRFEINVKNATVLGIVGAGGIGVTLITAMSAGRYRDATAALWGIIIVVLIIDYFSTKLRKKLVNG